MTRRLQAFAVLVVVLATVAGAAARAGRAALTMYVAAAILPAGELRCCAPCV